MKYLSVQEVALKWGLSESQVSKYCRNNIIPRAYKEKSKWKIPDDSCKPLHPKEIKQVLIGIVKMQNSVICTNSTSDISSETESKMKIVCDFLGEKGYILQDNNVPEKHFIKKILITEKGYYLLCSGITININIDDVSSLFTKVLSIAASLKTLSR